MSFNFSPRIVRDGLVLYLDAANNKSYTSGSTNWIDLSTGLNNGALQNAPTFNGSNYGNIVFDGINEYASFSTNPNLYFTGTSPYTLSVYANILTSTAIFSGFINRENAFPSPRNGYNMWFYADPTQVAIASERWTGDGVQKLTYILINNSECINVWNQYTVTYENSTLKFYLNGELKHTNLSATGNISNTSTPLEIGKRITDYGNFKLSNAMVYSKALSQAEVAQNYNTLKNRFRL